MGTFYANRSYVAENLCVNKDNPAMHCNGKCQLDKKLQDSDDKQQPNTDKKISFESTVFYFQPVATLAQGSFIEATTPKNGVIKPFSLQACYTKQLHPPAYI